MDGAEDDARGLRGFPDDTVSNGLTQTRAMRTASDLQV
jgi:hypothetical protein